MNELGYLLYSNYRPTCMLGLCSLFACCMFGPTCVIYGTVVFENHPLENIQLCH